MVFSAATRARTVSVNPSLLPLEGVGMTALVGGTVERTFSIGRKRTGLPRPETHEAGRQDLVMAYRSAELSEGMVSGVAEINRTPSRCSFWLDLEVTTNLTSSTDDRSQSANRRSHPGNRTRSEARNDDGAGLRRACAILRGSIG